jgi:hypothetical protein
MIDVELELGDIVRAVNEILARKEERKDAVWADVIASCDALDTLVGRLNDLYVTLLDDIQFAFAPSDRAQNEEEGLTEDDLRSAAIERIHRFLHDDNLIQLLGNLQGRIHVASTSRRTRRRRYREIVSALRGLDLSVNAYVEFLKTLSSETGEPAEGDNPQRIGIAEVLRYLEAREGTDQLHHLCEEAIRNRRLDLVRAIRTLAGEARQHIRMEPL